MVSRATVRDTPYSCCSPSKVSRLPGGRSPPAMAVPTASSTRSCMAGDPPSFASSARSAVAVDMILPSVRAQGAINSVAEGYAKV
jgi:hypothetical protein